MGAPLERVVKLKPRLTDAILFLATAVSTALLSGKRLVPPGDLIELSAGLSPIVWLCACALLFSNPRSGYRLALLAGLMILPWFVQGELSQDTWNSWVTLNDRSSQLMPQEVQADVQTHLALARLKILCGTLLVTAGSCSLIRLVPPRWTLQQRPLHLRACPPYVMGLIGLLVWFVCSATPYQIPAFDHPWNAVIRVLHVEKHGLSLTETAVVGYRDGRAYIRRSDRRLFQYSFNQTVAMTALARTSPSSIEQVATLVQSQKLWSLKTPIPTSLRSWNAEGWYVVLKDTRILTFTGAQPPKELTDFFREVESLPLRETQSFANRDVCFGFCYDPLAALGFEVLPQRERLLKSNSLGLAGSL
jgi:hypothetical protein